MGWVSIGVAIGMLVVGFVMYLVRRRDRRMDALELAVFGDGVNPGIHKYVTFPAMNERISELKNSLQGIAEAGVRREERILAAIENVRDVVGSEVMETKASVRTLNERIDEVMSFAARNSNQR